MKVQSIQPLSPQFGIGNGRVLLKPALGGAELPINPAEVSAVKQLKLNAQDFALQLGIKLNRSPKLHENIDGIFSNVTAIILNDGRTYYVRGAKEEVQQALA